MKLRTAGHHRRGGRGLAQVMACRSILILSLISPVGADPIPPPPPPPPPYEPAPVTPPPPAVPVSTAGSQNITLNFQNTDIDTVLQFFGQITGKIFIKSDAVRGPISVSAPGTFSVSDAMDILQSVLEVKGFALISGGGKVIKVLPQSEAAQQGSLEVSTDAKSVSEGADRMITQVVPLKFVSAQEFKNNLMPLMSKSGSLIADERVNSLVVTDMASNVRRLLKMVEALDVRPPQVLIEALLMEISLTDETKLGVEWNNKDSFERNGRQFGFESDQSFGLSNFITEGIKYSVIRADGNFTATLQALATDKNVNILSTPHIMTLNNQPAVIRVGEEVPVLTQTRNIQGGETILSYDYKSVAIELEVTPRINQDQEVLLKVHPLVKKILGFNAELNAPILASREAQTTVLIKSGQTVVIGGLMKDDRSSNQSKVPILGDIPIIGALFRKKSTSNEKTELLVFITPRVVLNSDAAEALTVQKESETKRKETPHRKISRDHYDLGRMYYREKRFDEAIEEFKQADALSPEETLKKRAQKMIKKAEKKKKTYR